MGFPTKEKKTCKYTKHFIMCDDCEKNSIKYFFTGIQFWKYSFSDVILVLFMQPF